MEQGRIAYFSELVGMLKNHFSEIMETERNIGGRKARR
jgi:hypothetical protein